MERALELAGRGRGYVSPNPMVGCVLVAGGRIIGEGWHRNYGKHHAEVEAFLDALSKGFEHEIAGATAYVTLEPCSHFGKTPPCVDLLISGKIGRVVVANTDPNPLVSGRGLSRLKEAGIEVSEGMLADDGEALNRRFFKGMTSGYPYVILKWAQSRDGYLSLPGEAVKISGELGDVIVHKWRAEEDAILVGKNTVLVDNPVLNVRKWEGRNPVRVVLDRNLAATERGLHVTDHSQPTIFVNTIKERVIPASLSRYEPVTEGRFEVNYLKVPEGEEELSGVLKKLYGLGIGSILVEGGAAVLEAFLQAGLWDEIRVICGTPVLGSGIRAPRPDGKLVFQEQAGEDLLSYFSSPK